MKHKVLLQSTFVVIMVDSRISYFPANVLGQILQHLPVFQVRIACLKLSFLLIKLLHVA